MTVAYTPLTSIELDLLAALEGFSAPTWTGPGLPRASAEEVFDTFDRILTRALYLIQSKDGLSMPYTLQGITASAGRFMLGTEAQVDEVAALRALITVLESFFNQTQALQGSKAHIATRFHALRAKVEGWVSSGLLSAKPVAASTVPPDPAADYSAFALEDPRQFSMAWTTFEDVFRSGYPHVEQYVAAVTDPEAATEQFWPTLASTALPYNLLVLQKLEAGTVESYKTNFGTGWTSDLDEKLAKGTLYGIDMTIFEDLAPQSLSNGTTRFTPSTMALLEMGADKILKPLTVYVADPQNINRAEVYVPSSPAWIYSLLALKTSLTVHGIWLGHVYTLHLVTAAMQMTMWNTFPPDHILYQALAPQSQFTIPFDFLLLLAWSHLSPPTSISDPGKFLTLCSKFAATHDFFSTDPATALAALDLDVAQFTSPAAGAEDWDLYPNVQRMLKVWKLTATYVDGIVAAGYATDADVVSDPYLQTWISAASDAADGNVAGLPRLDSRAALSQVLTSLLYRIHYHGVGRLRSMGTPEPSFATNYPPCLQSTEIPPPNRPLAVADLLRDYLPRTGTLGGLVSFYDLFSFVAPFVPLVPAQGAGNELFFDEDRFPGANEALIAFRQGVEIVVSELQPEWVQIGQWPRNIEL